MLGFSDWCLLAKDILHSTMKDLETKNITQLRSVLALRRLQGQVREDAETRMRQKEKGIQGGYGNGQKMEMDEIEGKEQVAEQKEKAIGLLKVPSIGQQSASLLTANAHLQASASPRGSYFARNKSILVSPRLSISPLPVLESNNPFDDVPEDDPDMKILIPQLRAALEDFGKELSSEDSLRKFFTLIDLDGDSKISKSEFVIAFQYMGFSLTRNRNTGHIEGFVLDKMYEAAAEGNLQKLSFFNQLSESSPTELGGCLFEAVKANQFEVAHYLKGIGADVNYQHPKTKQTSFHLAAGSDNVGMLELLVSGEYPELQVKDKNGIFFYFPRCFTKETHLYTKHVPELQLRPRSGFLLLACR